MVKLKSGDVRKTKILTIGMPFSIHTARWINNFKSDLFDIHLMSSQPYNFDLHKDISGITFYTNSYFILNKKKSIHYRNIDFLGSINSKSSLINKYYSKVLRLLKLESSFPKSIIKVINKVKPDIIHTLESQHAGYLLTEIQIKHKKKYTWIHSVWGIDFDYFINLKGHREKLMQMLRNIDHLIVEGIRDVKYAKSLGFEKPIDILQATGGFLESDILDTFDTYDERNLILLKGYDVYPRLGQNGLAALEAAMDVVLNNKLNIIVYSCGDILKNRINYLQSQGIPIEIIDEVDRETFINLNRKAIISLNINDTDGMPNVILEAMANGAFPIASYKSCLPDIIESGKNGYLVNPNDTNEIKYAIINAITNSSMRNYAMQTNATIIKQRYSFDSYMQMITQLYFS